MILHVQCSCICALLFCYDDGCAQFSVGICTIAYVRERAKWHLEMYHQILWWVYYYWHYCYNCCLLCIPFYIFIFILYSYTIFSFSHSLGLPERPLLLSLVYFLICVNQMGWKRFNVLYAALAWAWGAVKFRASAREKARRGGIKRIMVFVLGLSAYYDFRWCVRQRNLGEKARDASSMDHDKDAMRSCLPAACHVNACEMYFMHNLYVLGI